MADVDMQECTLSNVDDMMQSTMVQRQIEGASYMTVLPKVVNSSVIEFDINSSECFLELNKTEVEVKYRIKKADGTNLTAEDHVGTINYPVASLFSSVEVKLNDKTITYGSSNYAERAIMEVLMTYNHDALKSWLGAGLFEKDTTGRMDVADPSAADNVANHGLKKRAEHSKESKLVTVRGKLHEDLFNQPRPLPNNSRLYIRFTRNKDQYCLMSNAENANYKITIEEMSLHIRKIYVTDDVKKSLASQRIVLPIDRVIQKEFSVPQGGSKFIENALHSGQIPKRLVFAFVGNNAHVGSYTANPFNWAHVNVQKVSLFRDGQIVNARPLSVDFGSGDVMDGYWSLMRATNTRYANAGPLIKLDEYKKGGYALWAYDLSPSQCDEQFNDPKQRGNLTLEVEFGNNTTTPLVLCVYLQFDSDIIINEVGGVITMFD